MYALDKSAKTFREPVHIECSRDVGRFCYLILWPEIILGMLPVSNLSYATITCVHARTQLYSGVAVSRLHKEYVHVPECATGRRVFICKKHSPHYLSLCEKSGSACNIQCILAPLTLSKGSRVNHLTLICTKHVHTSDQMYSTCIIELFQINI